MALVCLCERVNDRAVRRAIASGASTTDEVAAACGAGSRCGGCRPTVDAMLDPRFEPGLSAAVIPFPERAAS